MKFNQDPSNPNSNIPTNSTFTPIRRPTAPEVQEKETKEPPTIDEIQQSFAQREEIKRIEEQERAEKARSIFERFFGKKFGGSV